MLIIEKITTGPSNVQVRLTPFEEREEPEEQHQHEFQFHQEDLTRHQQLDTRQDEMRQQHLNHEHSQHKQQQHQAQEQQQQQLHQQVQHQQQELQKLQQRNPCNQQLQPLQDRHDNVGTVSNEKRNIVIFGDSIPKGINRKILDQKLFNAKNFIDSSLAPFPQISFIILNQPCKTHRPISILQYYTWVLMIS